jgi:hypothetical protein
MQEVLKMENIDQIWNSQIVEHKIIDLLKK